MLRGLQDANSNAAKMDEQQINTCIVNFMQDIRNEKSAGNKKAGEKLKAMLAMGASEPWPAALKAMTGEDKMDATAIIDYFAPLKSWLDEQNASK